MFRQGKTVPETEVFVLRLEELAVGTMRQVDADGKPVLLVHSEKGLHALGAFCTHYKAPLVKGVLSGDRVVCPWHNACFALADGGQLEPPGLDALESYPVRVTDGAIWVKLPEDATGRRTPPMADPDLTADSRTFVIVGAGTAGSAAAEELRRSGFTGRILVLSADEDPPYDRTWLSKDYFLGKAKDADMPLRPPEFYARHGIELHSGAKVIEADPATRTLRLENGQNIEWDALLIATGGQARQLPLDGTDLPEVFTLRSYADSRQILAAAEPGRRAVVIGSSFIGMEMASGLTQRGVAVTVVSQDQVPFEESLGERIGRVFEQVHRENGVDFRFAARAVRFEGDKHLEAVVLESGERLPADLVVLGVGVEPATDFLQGIERSPDGGIVVDSHLQAADGVFAAGDIVHFLDRHGERLRVEHWRIASQQGRTAARNMLGRNEPFDAVPVFWTMQFKFPLRYVGHAEQWDEIIYDGDPEDRRFMAFFVREGRVVAVTASQRDTEMAAVHELLRLDRMPLPEVLRQHPADPVAWLAGGG